MKTKILFLSNIPTPYQLDFVRAIQKLADVRAVFLWNKEENRDWIIGEHYWVSILAREGNQPNWTQLHRILKDFKPKHVLVGGYRLPLALRLRWFCFFHKISYSFWLERPLPVGPFKAAIRKFIWAIYLPLAKQVFCVGRDSENTYRSYCKKTINLPYSIDATRYTPRKGKPTNPLRFIYIGQYIQRKGIDELLSAFVNVDPEAATLSMIGSGELESIVNKFTSRYKHIVNYGFVDSIYIPQLLSEHDVLVAPSRHDGWGVVVIEAMISGLPVIGTVNTGAFLDMVIWQGVKKNGSLCNVNSYSIYKAIKSYIEEPERVLCEGSRGRKKALISSAESGNAAKVLLDALNDS